MARLLWLVNVVLSAVLAWAALFALLAGQWVYAGGSLIALGIALGLARAMYGAMYE